MKRLVKNANELENETINLPNSNGTTIPVFKNPTDEEIWYLKDKFKEEYPNALVGEPKIRSTYDEDGNKYSWMSGDAMHWRIENYLYEKRGIKTNQNSYF